MKTGYMTAQEVRNLNKIGASYETYVAGITNTYAEGWTMKICIEGIDMDYQLVVGNDSSKQDVKVKVFKSIDTILKFLSKNAVASKGIYLDFDWKPVEIKIPF